MDNLRGELQVIKSMLNNNNIDEKIEGIKRVIVGMSIGKNMQEIFQSVIKCLEVNNLKIKKLIYLYIINNSRNCPDDALMIVNQFCKDARDPVPIIRALAIRTMGCLRVPKLNEYLIDPLLQGLQDQSSYVKKTAILCIPKVLEVSKELVLSKEVPQKVKDIIEHEKDPKMVATALMTLRDIQSQMNQPLQLKSSIVEKIFEYQDQFMEWDQIYVFGILLKTQILIEPDFHPIDFIMSIEEQLLPKLSHINKALVLASARLYLYYMELYEEDQEKIKTNLSRIITSLIGLFDSQYQTSFIALQVILGLHKKFKHYEIQLDPQDFYCQHQEPLYIKLLKLKVLKKIMKQKSSTKVIEELFSYVKSPDLEFSMEAVKAFFDSAQINPSLSTFKMIINLLDTIVGQFKENKNYILLGRITFCLNRFVLQFFMKQKQEQNYLKEIIIKSTPFLKIINILEECYQEFADDQGKIGFLEILSMFSEHFKKQQEIQKYFKQKFFEENEEIQLSIMHAFVILFLIESEESDLILMSLFEEINDRHHNPVIRDQAFIYWRLLTKDLAMAKKIFLEIPKEFINKRKKPIQNIIEIKHLGTFINQILLKNNNIPEFLKSNHYHKLIKKQNQKESKFTELDMKLVQSNQKKGKSGHLGIEIFGRLFKKDNYFIQLDIKNSSSFIHEIKSISIDDKYGGFVLSELDIKGRKIQKNEICMLEIQLNQQKSDINSIENLLHNLSLEVAFQTNIDRYEFKIPYLLNVLLNPNPFELDHSLKNDIFEDIQLVVENKRNKRDLFLKNNFVVQSDGLYYMRVQDQVIGIVKFENNEDFEVICKTRILVENYKYLIESLIEKIIYN